MSIRVGQGFDVHKFAQLGSSKSIRICGIDVPHEQALIAHSDGDVALHALCDALLGALGLGDIGTHFSDQDDEFADRDSRWFVEQVYTKIHSSGWVVMNADITIIGEKPKIVPYRQLMTDCVAQLLNVSLGQINIKATTTEQLGFCGRKEGLAAMAVVLVSAIGETQ